MRLYKRNSAGGQALHHWQQTGKHTTIHIVYELDQNITAAALTSAIEEKLLVRFPRFRGHVTANEKSWAVPDMSAIVSSDYVEVVNLAAANDEDEAKALQRHIELQMAEPLPPRCSWNVHLIRFGGRTRRCCILWRVSHTVADGVVLSQIMSSVLCDPIPEEKQRCASASESTACPSAPAAEARHPMRAGWMERIWRFVCGCLFVVGLLFWPSDRHTKLQLGPYRWQQRLSSHSCARCLRRGGDCRLSCR